MNQRKYQRGATIWTLLMGLLLLGFVVFTALKLFPVYMDDFSIGSSVAGLEEDHLQQYRTAIEVQNALIRRFGINNVSQVKRDDISVIRDGAFFNVEVEYEVVLPYIGNMSLLMHFDHKATVPIKYNN